MEEFKLDWKTENCAGVIDVNASFPASMPGAGYGLTELYRQAWDKFASSVLKVPQGYPVNLVRVEFWPDSGQVHLIPSSMGGEAVGRSAQMNLQVPELLTAWQAYEVSAPLQTVKDLVARHAAAVFAALQMSPLHEDIRAVCCWFDEPLEQPC